MNAVGSSPVDERGDVIFFTDQETGLRGITVLDDAGLSPAVGACRSRPYVDEERALGDALRQARTTTAKALIAGLPVSGACTVLLSSSPVGSRAASPMPAIGRAVEMLGGRYRLLPDLQGDLKNMEEAAGDTTFLLGRPSDIEIDPAAAAALGLRHGIAAAVRRRLGRESLMGVRIGIIGLGDVGFSLAEILRQEGARLTVADRDPRRTERAVRALGITCVTTEEIIHLDMDVLAPTAAKETVQDGMISHLRCKIVAGAVDDALQSPMLGKALHDRGILYLPDSVVNAGGLISLVQPLLGEEARAIPLLDQLRAIGDRLVMVMERAEHDNLATAVAAERLAEEILARRLGIEPAQQMAS
ncbi:MAG: NAD(P)-binding domain-containing protein [Alphaproteobacteria bacterium]